MRTLAADALQDWSAALLAAAGLEEDAAATVAETLVATSLRGVDSHGVARLPIYVERLRAGVLNPRPRPRWTGATAPWRWSTATAGRDRSPACSPPTCRSSWRASSASARSRCTPNHYGAAGIYAARAARAGMIGVSTTNADPLAVPFGGARKALGTNPIAFAAPTAGRRVRARHGHEPGRRQQGLQRARRGPGDPGGLGRRRAGAAITDPNEFYAVVPLGGYKGYGLALMVEVLSGVLAGAGVTHGVAGLFGNLERPQGLGHFHLALDPERTVGRERFASVLSGLLDELRAIPPAPGLRGGAGRRRPRGARRARARRRGIPLPDALVETLEALSGELGVPVPEARPPRGGTHGGRGGGSQIRP